MVRACGFDEAGRLLTVHSLNECAMQECIFDIQLMDGPIAADGEGENCADGRRLNDGAECRVVVEVGLLREAAQNPLRLVPS